MDKTPQRRSTASVKSSTPSSLRHCLYPSMAAAASNGNISPRQRPKLKQRADPSKPAALTRVKRRSRMDSSSQMDTDMPWPNGTPSMTGSPKAPSQNSRSKTPELTSASHVNPSSSLLQDLLREQRATRGSRGTASEDFEDNSPRTPRTPGRSRANSQSQSQEEPGSEKQRKINNALASGLKHPREMGMREMDQYISKINKQNFDLKLEIFHRAQQMVVLEKRLERMLDMEEELQRMRELEDELQELRDAEEDNQRLRESNEQLRQEIDKRDQAVTEAVDLICQLEGRIEELEVAGDCSRPSTARPSTRDEPDVATPRPLPAVEIPERRSSKQGGLFADEQRRRSSGSRHLKRAPSFLQAESKNTAALRSVYSPADDHSRSGMSVLSQSESFHSINDTGEPDSPRLSALSECSELHVSDLSGVEADFDELEIPIRRRESAAAASVFTIPARGAHEHGHRNLTGQAPPQQDVADTPRRKNRSALDAFKSSDKPSFESDSFGNSSSQQRQVDSVFGSSRLPPTPDTMSTAYAFGANGSNGSGAEKCQLDHPLALRRGLRRPRSAEELVPRRSSGNNRIEGTDTNISEVMHPRVSADEEDETPAIFPLNSISSKMNYFNNQGVVDRTHFGYYKDGVLLNEDGLEEVLSKLEKDYYSPPKPIEAEEPPVHTPSGSPPLTPQDWVEAAKTDNRPRKKYPRAPTIGPVPPPRLAGARAPSQSSFLGRRHSVDSNVQDIPGIPTLDIGSLEPARQPEPDPEPRRRISFRPRFFGRSSTSRRLQPSPMPDGANEGNEAPSPVVPKTRQLGSSKPSNGDQTEKPMTSYDNARSFGPTYSDSYNDENPKPLSHSFTESNLLASSNANQPSSNGKGHKRRSSLGIIGWMKGASGLGSHSKKSDFDSSVMSTQSCGSVKDRTSSRLTKEHLAANPEIRDPNLASMHVAVEDFAPNASRISWVTGEEPSRRPRYMDRRRRA
ncbi:hypothetical protein BDV25DRAFT_166542 [Aspergillus avenaceus]|uniref:Uncharacterized protein n=1 Tax=Aspergillus avenaceus TaxID=36643 RepID=A0A5N6TEL5_ASPAV|nr:hypothetical protein BDV25DRAFT_166542 [Aspergillus avenaceus]